MQFDKLRNNLPHSWVLFCMDYGQNYNCHFQDEAQSAHWSYQQATITSIVAYYHCPDDQCSEVTRESMVFISDDRSHDHKAVHHFVTLANEHISRQGVQINREIHFSDGAGSQYKNKSSFNDASYGVKDYGFPVEKHFFGSRHGKGPCDGEIGVLKKCAAVAVKGRQVIIRDAHDLFKYGQNFLSLPRDVQEHSHAKRTFFFVREGEVLTDFRMDATFVGKRSNYALKSGMSLEMADGQEADATSSEANGQTKPTYTYAKGSFVMCTWQRCGDNLYKWPSQRDVSWEPRENVVCPLDFPDLANKREQFRFKKSDLTIIEKPSSSRTISI
ncbi:hypothetical protein BSL78_21840 [Apostichopus japonicus]|uniref:Uncharacterized protein n=1 Tax=Stichopus japonicus TaxID=307972 RepID=A0A2G8JZZ1_STIJA|nr:hypothetical protein BSL78_21840 [Apostichopus japonicus]